MKIISSLRNFLGFSTKTTPSLGQTSRGIEPSQKEPLTASSEGVKSEEVPTAETTEGEVDSTTTKGQVKRIIIAD